MSLALSLVLLAVLLDKSKTMEYVNRLGKVVLAVLCFFARIILRIGFVAMTCIQLFMVLILFVVALVLYCIEFLTVRTIYYIVTGKKYTDTYNNVIDMFGDLITFGIIKLKKIEDYSKYRDRCIDEWYANIWNSISKLKVELYPKKEK